jgi:opacity protein-like surface antigen
MKGKLSGIGIAALFSMSAVAGGMGGRSAPPPPPPLARAGTCAKVITLSVGPAWYNNSGRIQRNFLIPLDIFHTYVPENASGVVGTGEIFFALARPVFNQVSGQLGLAAAYSGNGKARGRLHIGYPVYTETYAYSYQLASTRIAMKGKLASEWAYWAKPYISASAGVGFTRSWNYESPYSIYPRHSQGTFSSETAYGFSYTAGIGVQTYINTDWQIGIGYEFADWGKNRLARPRVRIPATELIQYPGLHSPSFYTHELQFSVSYIM